MKNKIYVGIDYHKRYSIASAVSAEGEQLKEAKIVGNCAVGFERYFESLGGSVEVVLECCWNWGRLYDLLEEMEVVERVVLADPYKTRLIAEAQIKNDRLDARKLAELLRGNFIATVHIPTRHSRERKQLLRQRMFWVRQRTQLRNRIHALLDRQRSVELPQVSDLFGRKGMNFLKQLSLAEPDSTLLRQDLDTLELLGTQIKQLEKALQTDRDADHVLEQLRSIPGIGLTLSAVIAAEIDTISRFPKASKLCSYCGLVPTTHASGGKVYHGRMLPHCNKWLRWAFVEAAWVAVGCSSYFGTLYRQHRLRGKAANKAIAIVARRLCQIVWQILTQKRPYEPRSLNLTLCPERSEQSLVN